MRRPVLVMAALLCVAGCTEAAAPRPPDPEVGFHHPAPEPAPPVPAGEAANYSGIGQLLVQGQCTATLLDLGVSHGPAYALTNGHCAGGWGSYPDFVQIDGEVEGTIRFGVVGGQDQGPEVEVVRIAYATMRDVDLALVELDATVADLAAHGVTPVPIAAAPAAPGLEVVNVGVPVRDLPQDEWLLRRGECTVRAAVTVLEGEWTWRGALANDCPGILQGSSGSPLLTADGVVGVINTTTFAGLVRGGACALNNPCEAGGEVRVVPDTSYASPVAGVGACFDAEGRFDLAADCPLPRPRGLAASAFPSAVTLDSVRAGVPMAVTVLSAAAGAVRHGVVPVTDDLGCDAEAAYTETGQVAAGDLAGDGLIEPTVPVRLPAQEGHYWWCVTAGTAMEASRVLIHVDGTPPLLEPRLVIEDIGGAFWVSPAFVHPELSASMLAWGEPGTVDCDDRSAYRQFLSVPFSIDVDELPVDVCLVSADLAGNEAPVVRTTVG